MDKPLFDRIIVQLLPDMTDADERKALVESALFGSPVLERIDWSGAARGFTVRLVRTLEDYGEVESGKPAIVVLLEELYENVGTNRKQEICQLIDKLTNKEQERQTIMSVEALGFAFLIDVGRWSMAELKERWTLRRKEKAIETDKLTDDNLAEEVQPVLDDLTQELDEKEINHRVEMIEKRRDLIRDWKSTKLTNEKANLLGQMTLAAVEANEKFLNEKINKALREIETDLKALGFEVEKTQVE